MSNLDIYHAVRPKLQTGDLLLWQSKSILGWLIRKFSKADVNHAGLVIRFSEYDVDRVYTLEALEPGIVLRSLSERLENHKGKAWWHALKPEFDSDRWNIGGISLANVGTKYDYTSLFSQITSRVSVEASRFFCSEFCHWCWERAGIPLVSNVAPRPGDLVDYSILEEGVRIL